MSYFKIGEFKVAWGAKLVWEHMVAKEYERCGYGGFSRLPSEDEQQRRLIMLNGRSLTSGPRWPMTRRVLSPSPVKFRGEPMFGKPKK